MPEKLGDFAERMAQGIRTSANDIYVVDLQFVNGNICSVNSMQLEKEVQIENKIRRLFLQGREIRRYSLLYSGKLVIVPYSVMNGKSSLISIHDLKSKFPLALGYLLENRKYLEDREHGRMRGSSWYAYVYPKNLEIMSQPKILVPDIANRAQFAFDESGKFAFTSGYGITLKQGIKISPLYVLGYPFSWSKKCGNLIL
jgi:TaqI-like C-terminal specificity domain